MKLLLEDGSEYPLEGRLRFNDVTVDSGTGSYIVRMSFPNPKADLMPGMYVRALVQEGVVEAALLVPQQAVSRDAKGNPYALIVDKEGKVRQQAITIDRTSVTNGSVLRDFSGRQGHNGRLPEVRPVHP